MLGSDAEAATGLARRLAGAGLNGVEFLSPRSFGASGAASGDRPAVVLIDALDTGAVAAISGRQDLALITLGEPRALADHPGFYAALADGPAASASVVATAQAARRLLQRAAATARAQVGVSLAADIGQFEMGDDFLRALVARIAVELDFTYAFVARPRPDGLNVDTVALYANGAIADNFSYALAGTPCQNVFSGERVSVHPVNVQPLFPDDALLVEMGVHAYVGAPILGRDGELIGLLVALDTKDRDDAPALAPAFDFLAGRVGAELERAEAQARLTSINADLEARVQDARHQLVLSAHRAGMADIASQVLHNVGNLLNSVATSVQVLRERESGDIPSRLRKVEGLLRASEGRIDEDQARGMGAYLSGIAEAVEGRESTEAEELARLSGLVEVLTGTIQMQQRYAAGAGRCEAGDVWALVKTAAELLRASFERHGVILSVSIQSEGPGQCVASFERHKLLNAVTNVLTNARQALDGLLGERHVVMTCGRAGERVFITIRDNGGGISEDDLPHIFEWGFTTRAEGHGLGLHASANDLNAMGGGIYVRSEGPGRGAEFTLWLPEAEADTDADTGADAAAD